MSVKAVYFIHDFTEEAPPQTPHIAAHVRAKALNGLGTGVVFEEWIIVDVEKQNLNLQIHDRVKAGLQALGVTFGPDDTIVTLPSTF